LLTAPTAQALGGALILAVVLATSFARRWRPLDSLASIPFVRRLRELSGAEEAGSLLGALTHGRLSVSGALHTAALAVTDPAWRKLLSQAERDVLAGQRLSASLAAQKAAPRLFVRVCELGEASEDLPRALTDLGSFYHHELDRYTKRVLRLGEVSLMYALGAFIAVYALGIWLPLATITGTMVP
jgi:type II secretory pathway component PulF